MEEDPILTPGLALRKQLQALTNKRMKRMRHLKKLRRSVRIPCSRQPC
jgi:hypothetical protein